MTSIDERNPWVESRFAGDHVMLTENWQEPINAICPTCWLDHPEGGCDR